MGEKSLSTNDGKPGWDVAFHSYLSSHRKPCGSLLCATLPLCQIGNISTRCCRFIPGAALFFVEDSMTKVSTQESYERCQIHTYFRTRDLFHNVEVNHQLPLMECSLHPSADFVGV